jgi:hypothetical protein
MVKVLVCGGRKGVQNKKLFRVLDDVWTLLQSTGITEIEIAEGRAIGVDQGAGAWADRKANGHWTFPINNDLDGLDPMRAPKRRNQRMLDIFKPDLCVAFPGGNGTNDMADRCHKAGVPVWDVEMHDDAEFSIVRWAPRAGPDVRCTLIHIGFYDDAFVPLSQRHPHPQHPGPPPQ